MTTARTALITGASTGIGSALARRLLAEGWRVTTLARTPLREDDAPIGAALASGALRHYRADLANHDGLRAAIARITAEHDRLDVLFNNAGAMPGTLELSPQGRELGFEINAVVPYILTRELEPLLRRGSGGKVIHSSSNSLLMVRRFDPATLERPTTFKKLTGPYGQSKLALTLWTSAFVATGAAGDLRLLSVDPGPTRTPMSASSGMPGWLLPLRPLLFRSPERAAGRLYDAATELVHIPNGAFVLNGRQKKIPFSASAGDVLRLVEQAYEKFKNL